MLQKSCCSSLLLCIHVKNYFCNCTRTHMLSPSLTLLSVILHMLLSTDSSHFWPTVLSVESMAQCVVCLSVVCPSSVCNVLYCGETVRPSEKVSEGVNRKPGQKVHFLGCRHISTSGFAATATKTAVFALFLLVQPSNWY